MGRLISEKITNLIQGVSQQAPELKRPEQAVDQLNCWNSFVDGMKKRPGGVYQAEYAIPAGFVSEGAQWSFIDYGDAFGRFVVAVDVNGKLAGFTEDGTQVTISGNDAYLRMDNGIHEGRKFSFLPHGTAAFVLNKAAPAMPRPDRIPFTDTVPLIVTAGRKDHSFVFHLPQGGEPYSFAINGETLTFAAMTPPVDVARQAIAKFALHYPDLIWRQSGSVVTGRGAHDISVDFADGSVGGCAAFAQATVVPPDVSVPRLVGYAHIKQGDYGTTYTVNIKVGNTPYTATHKTPDGSDPAHRDQISMRVIRDSMMSAINALGMEVSATSVGETGMSLYATTDEPVSVWAEDDVNQAAIKAFDDSVTSEDDLPHECVPGYTVRVSAQQEGAAYYLRYEDEESEDAGMWVECAKPLEPFKVWGETLPHLLAPSVDASGVATLHLQVAQWDDRKTGDAEATPYPEVISVVTDDTLVARTVASVGLYQSRLVMLGGPYLTMSRTNAFFNLFPASMLSELDTDPIGLLLTGQKGQMVNGFHVIPTEHDVLVLGDSHQVDLGSDSGVMTPMSVYSKPKTAYEMDPAVDPVLIGDAVYFIDKRGDFSACLLYSTRDQAGGRYAYEVSQHCPTFIGGAMDIMVGTPQGTLLLKPEGTTKTAYVYQFLDAGSAREQSAWSRWEFTGNLLNAEFRDGNLSVLVQYADTSVERHSLFLTIDSEAKALGIPLHLDSRKNHGDVKPTDLREGEQAFRRGNVWFSGFTYMQRYEMGHLQSWNAADQQAVTEGRLQVRRIKFLYRDTTSFDVIVSRKGEGRSAVRQFRGRIVGSLNNIIGKTPVESGQFSVPVMSRNTDATLTIENNGPHDCCILSAEWEGFYNARTLQW